MTPKEDLFNIMDFSPDAFDVVVKAIQDGRIDGRSGILSINSKCGCLKAHTAQAYKKRSYEMFGPAKLIPCFRSPIEEFVLDAKPGQNPSNSRKMRALLSWLQEWKSTCIETEEGVEFE